MIDTMRPLCNPRIDPMHVGASPISNFDSREHLEAAPMSQPEAGALNLMPEGRKLNDLPWRHRFIIVQTTRLLSSSRREFLPGAFPCPPTTSGLWQLSRVLHHAYQVRLEDNVHRRGHLQGAGARRRRGIPGRRRRGYQQNPGPGKHLLLLLPLLRLLRFLLLSSSFSYTFCLPVLSM